MFKWLKELKALLEMNNHLQAEQFKTLQRIAASLKELESVIDKKQGYRSAIKTVAAIRY